MGFKLGVIGTGRIAGKVVGNTLCRMKEITLYAVASRDEEKAQAFKNEYGFEKAYCGYENLAKDSDVDLVYVCVPHPFHFEVMKLCIENGRNVICEKPFTLNADQAEEIKDMAEKHGVFVTEAIWPRYMPFRKEMANILSSDEIGTPSFISANLFYNITHKERIVDINLGGGALLDVGVYAINFALMAFGNRLSRIESSVTMTGDKANGGVDLMDNITFFWADGKMASLCCGTNARSDRSGFIYASKGFMSVDNINSPTKITVFDKDGNKTREIDLKPLITGYEYEFLECMDCIREGRKQSYSMPLDDTIDVLSIMDKIRKQWGLRYPAEN